MTRMFNWFVPAAVAAIALTLSFTLSAQDKAPDKPAEKPAALGTIKGVVKDKDGNLAAGADVQARKPAARRREGAGKDAGQGKAQGARAQAADAKPADGQRRRSEPVAKTMTNDKGEYTLEVPAGEYILNARLMGKGNANQPVKVEPAKTVEANLTLQQGRRRDPAAADAK